MSYSESLKAAGAEIHEFKEFGSYQGDWWAKVTYNGETGWVNGSYGSCSGCDAFEAEFGWDDDEKPDYQQRLADFGRPYLEGLMTQEAAEKAASEHLEWDSDAAGMLEFIKGNAVIAEHNMAEKTRHE